MMQQLYFVAIIPPPGLRGAITDIKQDFKERFNSKHALRLVPHITLKAPFSCNDDQRVIDWFTNIPVAVSPFEQKLHNFNCFANKRNPVIFIDPELGPALKQLQKEVILDFKNNFPSIQVPQNELRFHPHMTVGYRDLSYENFKLAWSEYKDRTFDVSFMVENFCLLQHDKKQWNIINNHDLK
jgi:2'-5' RNA ligase